MTGHVSDLLKSRSGPLSGTTKSAFAGGAYRITGSAKKKETCANNQDIVVSLAAG